MALLAGSWSRVRANVEPAGLSRSRRILSLAPMLMVLGAIVGSAVLFGSGSVLVGLGTLAAASVAFASFLGAQIAARPPTASGRHEERDAYDLRRTPGVAGLGAMASLYGLIVGASTDSLLVMGITLIPAALERVRLGAIRRRLGELAAAGLADQAAERYARAADLNPRGPSA